MGGDWISFFPVKCGVSSTRNPENTVKHKGFGTWGSQSPVKRRAFTHRPPQHLPAEARFMPSLGKLPFSQIWQQTGQPRFHSLSEQQLGLRVAIWRRSGNLAQLALKWQSGWCPSSNPMIKRQSRTQVAIWRSRGNLVLKWLSGQRNPCKPCGFERLRKHGVWVSGSASVL